MSIAIFNGLSGLLRTLVGRITSDRAAGLDHLDADVSSRAPASTAMSKAVWTDALATLLLGTAGKPVVPKSPIAAGYVYANQVISGSWVDVLHLPSSDGYISKLIIDGTSFASAELIIDGLVVWSSSGAPGLQVVIGDYSSSMGVVIDGTPIYWSQSLKIRAQGPATVTYRYVRTR